MKFIDAAGNEVTIIQGEPVHQHVLVIPRYNGQFVLTRHKERGIEFPGGKVEKDETAVEAAARELYEETGAAGVLRYITSYHVASTQPFTKDVFYCHVNQLEEKADYMETEGPVLLDTVKHIAGSSVLLTDSCIQYIVDVMIDVD